MRERRMKTEFLSVNLLENGLLKDGKQGERIPSRFNSEN